MISLQDLIRLPHYELIDIEKSSGEVRISVRYTGPSSCPHCGSNRLRNRGISVSRFKICSFELGDTSLTDDEQKRIRQALQAEAERVRDISIHINFARPEPEGARRSSDAP